MLHARYYPEASSTATDVAAADISARIPDGTQPEGLLWVDVSEPTSDEIAVLVDEFRVHHLAAEDLYAKRQRPKLVTLDHMGYLTFQDVEMSGLDLVTREVDVLFGPGWIVTVRQKSRQDASVMDIAAVQAAFEADLHDAHVPQRMHGFFLYCLLDVVVDRCFDTCDEIEERLEAIETVIFEPHAAEVTLQERIYRLRHALVQFRRVVGPLREVVNALLRDPNHVLTTAGIEHFRELQDHLLRVMDFNEMQRDLLTGALDAHLAIVSNQMNKVMKLMTSWGAILFASTIIAGIYGMNFKNMPELHWQYGYPYSIGLMLTVTIALYLLFRRKNWL